MQLFSMINGQLPWNIKRTLVDHLYHKIQPMKCSNRTVRLEKEVAVVFGAHTFLGMGGESAKAHQGLRDSKRMTHDPVGLTLLALFKYCCWLINHGYTPAIEQWKIAIDPQFVKKRQTVDCPLPQLPCSIPKGQLWLSLVGH